MLGSGSEEVGKDAEEAHPLQSAHQVLREVLRSGRGLSLLTGRSSSKEGRLQSVSPLSHASFLGKRLNLITVTMLLSNLGLSHAEISVSRMESLL